MQLGRERPWVLTTPPCGRVASRQPRCSSGPGGAEGGDGCAGPGPGGASPGGSVAMTVPECGGAAQAALLRDVFGNPSRPVSLTLPSWTPALRALSQAAYDERTLPSGELDPA